MSNLRFLIDLLELDRKFANNTIRMIQDLNLLDEQFIAESHAVFAESKDFIMIIDALIGHFESDLMNRPKYYANVIEEHPTSNNIRELVERIAKHRRLIKSWSNSSERQKYLSMPSKYHMQGLSS